MQHTHLGSSGLTVSRLALGTMNFGPVIDRDAAFAVLDAAREAGITLIDTADQYGGPGREGWSEQILGDWLQARGCRDEMLVATKVHEPMGPGPNDRGLSAHHIRHAAEASLRRLGTDHVDLYQVHHVDRTTPWDETLRALDRLVRDGKTTYVGSSNLAGWHVATAHHVARELGVAPFVSEQHRYSLAQRTAELEVLPAARAHGVGVLAWSPLAGGLLAGAVPAFGDAEANRQAVQAQATRLAAYRDICAQVSASPSQVALAWLLHQPGLVAPVVGPRDPQQVGELAAATDLHLDADVLTALDALWPGPGGPAPEAYAW